ncbi:tRNA (adenosine(37)-N6)-threonylcarbamoyltransferase complex dimerization subunit type 1 TsaB [Ulvibacterium sp.]|uniref:tRNA (adenosine(37)-N6)-threonylcarbamoyltransferase complex dimerization subunit type 1 TsaB n=1 Tax=Ulvibacterium sp. TaxID=2665914 RepID=UPI003CC55A14
MAIILNLETATTNCSVSVVENDNIIVLKEDNTPNYSHSEQLHVFIKNVLDKASLSFSDLDAIAVSKGPGSYTGLRIGVSAAKGLCFALDIPLISIATLESMAHQARTESCDFIIPVLDARRMEVYSAVFNANFNQIRETKAEIITESSFSEYAKTGKTLLLGPGAKKCGEVLKHTHFDFMDDVIPSAKEMSKLSYLKYQKSVFEDVAYFEPYYLKDFITQGKN